MQIVTTLGLVAVTAIWGWTFTVVKEAVSQMDVATFLFWRFAVASVLLSPWLGIRRGTLLVRHGVGAGIWLAAAYLLQTYGVAHTSPTNCGLITGLFVLFTPLIQRFVQRRVLSHRYWICASASFLGIAMLTGGGWTLPKGGDVLTLGAALCFAAHVVFLERVAACHAAQRLAAWQFVTATALFGVVAWHGGQPWQLSPRVVPAVFITGVLATALGFLLQTWVQQRLAAVRVAVILTTESAFAALFGVWLAGDRLTPLQWCGAVLMFGATVGTELYSRSSQNTPHTTGSDRQTLCG